MAHLYRRAAFGPTWQQLQEGPKKSPAELVDALLEYDPAEDPFNSTLDTMAGFVDIRDVRTAQTWWIYRCLNTPRPLQEKLALVWHNHFATSAAKVSQDDLMHKQIEMFRAEGIGSFRDLLLGVGRNPAMLIWLDGRASRKRKPNENYAREVMELFALGVGNYSEADIKQLARCFTGWNLRDNEGVFTERDFDEGEKTIFGKTGKFNDEAAVDLLLAQPAAARHLATRLLFEFVRPHADPKLVDELAAVIVKNNWEIKPTLRTLLLSRVFYSDYAYRSRIKSPAELTVGLANTMGGKIKTQFVRDVMNRMGQSLLYPPNVKGWDGDQAWINAGTYIERMNYGFAVAQQRGQDYSRHSSLQKLIEGASESPDQVVDRMLVLLLDGGMDQGRRGALVEYLAGTAAKKKEKFNPKQENARGIRSLIHVITTMPEYQLA